MSSGLRGRGAAPGLPPARRMDKPTGTAPHLRPPPPPAPLALPADRLANFHIRVGNNRPSTSDPTFTCDPECYAQAAASALVATYTCATPLAGRYLSIALEQAPLTLCEVVVNGAANPAPPPLPPAPPSPPFLTIGP